MGYNFLNGYVICMQFFTLSTFSTRILLGLARRHFLVKKVVGKL